MFQALSLRVFFSPFFNACFMCFALTVFKADFSTLRRVRNPMILPQGNFNGGFWRDFWCSCSHSFKLLNFYQFWKILTRNINQQTVDTQQIYLYNFVYINMILKNAKQTNYGSLITPLLPGFHKKNEKNTLKLTPSKMPSQAISLPTIFPVRRSGPYSCSIHHRFLLKR